MLTLRPVDPQTLELCQETPRSPCSWSDPSLLSEECSQIRDDAPWTVSSAIYQGLLHALSVTTATILNPEGLEFDATHTRADWEFNAYLNQLTSPIVAEQRALADPANRSSIELVELGLFNVGTAGDIPCLDLQAEAEPK
jgi:hypothetical protein